MSLNVLYSQRSPSLHFIILWIWKLVFLCSMYRQFKSLKSWKILGRKNKSMKYLKMSSLIFFFYGEFWIVPCYTKKSEWKAEFRCHVESRPRFYQHVNIFYTIWIKISVEHITEESSFSRTVKLAFYKVHVITFVVKDS